MAMASLQAGLHAPFSASLPPDHSLSRTSTLPISRNPAPKDRSNRHSHHGINGHHRHHHHRRKSRDDENPKIPQSAFVTSNPFEGFLHHSSKSSQRLPDDSPASRGEREREAATTARKESKDARGTNAQWQEVERLRRERWETEETLHNSLTHLQTLGTTLTRRLDYAYYNLLSSIPLLRASLSELQSLSEQTSQLKTHLFSQIPALEAQTQAQLAALTSSYGATKDEADEGEDTGAQSRIAALEERMRVAREKVEGLGVRVEGVKKSIEEFENRERVGRERSGWWLRICWVCLSVGVGFWVLLLGLGVGYRGGVGDGVEVNAGQAVAKEALAGVGAEFGDAVRRRNSSRDQEGHGEGERTLIKEDEPAWERTLNEL